ncbi:cobalt/nickel transport system ATP-binding protein [Oryzomicrobium terrae]|uniref:ABC transporter ATP-binding protein n=2 Tax=Oryzomicrobium terrae TaxID=1735038 RepID=A0A5C1E8Z6_9RHOO|nr:cobalt/nickel transport system ATP-binding protein [Oryzomicrobium terrae]
MSPMNPLLLELDQVAFRYPDGSVGLDGCSLAIARGSRNALIGANGSGKTTLFQHCNALLRPAAGQLRYGGTSLDYSRTGLRSLRSKVGMVFQNPDRQLFSASVREDVSFGPLNLGLDDATVAARVEAALQAVGMEDLAHKPVQNLSFGQKKRVCIAGVLAMEPELLVLDEPMAGLDPFMQEELLTVLEKLHGRGMTILLATHDIHFAYRWADRIHLMAAGRCTASFDAPALATHEAELAAVGLRLPSVIGLEKLLRQRGLLDGDTPIHSCSALLAQLQQHDC